MFGITPEGTLFNVAQLTFLDFPNGIDLSPDESVLYASDIVGPIRAWDVAPDGSTSNQRVFGDAFVGDGTAVDSAGNLYVASLAGVQVFAPDGSLWGAIEVPRQPTNCGFGGADNRTLYITAQQGLYSVETVIAGIP